MSIEWGNYPHADYAKVMEIAPLLNDAWEEFYQAGKSFVPVRIGRLTEAMYRALGAELPHDFRDAESVAWEIAGTVVNDPVFARIAGEPEARIWLDVHVCELRRSFLVGFATEDQALNFMERKGSYCAFHQIDQAPIRAEYGRILEVLYPTCVHGLSEWLCEGPSHYGPGW
ncbi:hypothetical protein [Nonomuraea roseola]|uniref:DUF4240 domain-containing protein n=1 Tax=Nonomuraea roseola TaxID=46179 RepID=A0ABV5Q185_9ACTN